MIAFATKRFHQYVYGNTVTVQSDHKPLEVIFKKHLSKAPARLQRMLLQLQRYDLRITYTSSKNMHVADTLSRAVVTECKDDAKEDLFEERVVHAMEATDIRHRHAHNTEGCHGYRQCAATGDGNAQ